VDRLVGGRLLEKNNGQKLKLLDLGCANGKDMVTFLDARDDLEIVGIDIKDLGLRQSNFQMVVADAEKIDFPDNHFDIAVSMGVLEHIQPIEKLCRVISEIDRVSKEFVVIVPCVNTLIEPHTASLLWQLRATGKKKSHLQLNYFSDEAWMKFEGFSKARNTRFGFIPSVISNLAIYRTAAKPV
jgi:ubiquinone/menaquinone biosynthesis C-methylase UbiE